MHQVVVARYSARTLNAHLGQPIHGECRSRCRTHGHRSGRIRRDIHCSAAFPADEAVEARAVRQVAYIIEDDFLQYVIGRNNGSCIVHRCTTIANHIKGVFEGVHDITAACQQAALVGVCNDAAGYRAGEAIIGKSDTTVAFSCTLPLTNTGTVPNNHVGLAAIITAESYTATDEEVILNEDITGTVDIYTRLSFGPVERQVGNTITDRTARGGHHEEAAVIPAPHIFGQIGSHLHLKA